MALLTFPLIDPAVAPQVGARRTIRTATVITRMQSGLERRRLLRTIPGQELTASWGVRDESRWIAEQLAAFFVQTGGPAIPFVAYDFDYTFGHQRVYVGTADGTEDTWALPCRKTATSLTVYVDGTAQTSGITITTTGDNDRALLAFTAAPTAGGVITCSFIGQRAWVCRFADDELDLTTEEAGSYGVQVGLIEVRGEE